MQRICLVQFFTWLAWFNFILYITSWVGENIYGGNPDAADHSSAKELFDEGVRKAALGLSLSAAVAIGTSLALPKLAQWIGIKIVFLVGNLILGVCLIVTLWIKSSVGAIAMIATTGIPWAVVMSLPFTLVALAVEEEETGLFMGVLNIFVVIPQIIVALGVGFLLNQFRGNFVAALAAGGGAAFIAAILCVTLITTPKPPQIISVE